MNWLKITKRMIQKNLWCFSCLSLEKSSNGKKCAKLEDKRHDIYTYYFSLIVELIRYWKKSESKENMFTSILFQHCKSCSLDRNSPLDWEKTILYASVFSFRAKNSLYEKDKQWGMTPPTRLLQKVGLCKTVTENWDSKRHLLELFWSI